MGRAGHGTSWTQMFLSNNNNTTIYISSNEKPALLILCLKQPESINIYINVFSLNKMFRINSFQVITKFAN